MSVTVRYFAAAAEAAGTTEGSYPGETLGALLDALVERHGTRLGAVVARCSVLVDGVRTDDRDAPLTSGSVVDVLPPFAGG